MDINIRGITKECSIEVFIQRETSKMLSSHLLQHKFVIEKGASKGPKKF